MRFALKLAETSRERGFDILHERSYASESLWRNEIRSTLVGDTFVA